MIIDSSKLGGGFCTRFLFLKVKTSFTVDLSEMVERRNVNDILAQEVFVPILEPDGSMQSSAESKSIEVLLRLERHIRVIVTNHLALQDGFERWVVVPVKRNARTHQTSPVVSRSEAFVCDGLGAVRYKTVFDGDGKKILDACMSVLSVRTRAFMCERVRLCANVYERVCVCM